MIPERVLLLLACCLCLLAGVAAAEAIPCDRDGDGTLASAELAAAILDSLDGRCMGGTVEAPSPTDLQDAAFIYTHWGGRALTITDSTGWTTTVFRPLRRIAIYNDNILTVMRILGVKPDLVVGVEQGVFKNPNYSPEYQGKVNLGKWSPDYEQLVSTRPDGVFFYTISGGPSAEIAKTLSAIDPGIRFFRFDCYRPTTYADEVQMLALLLGKQEEAARFLAFHGNVTGTVAGAVEKIPAEDRVLVYLECGDYKSGGKPSGYHEKIELAGGRNIFADNPAMYPEVNPEEVIIRNPDVIIRTFGSGGYSDDDRSSFETTHRSIINRPAWDQIAAVRDGRVHIIHSDIVGGSDCFISIAYMAKWFYPDLFPDLDPRAIHQQYLREFLRLDYDLDKHGAFVYPA